MKPLRFNYRYVRGYSALLPVCDVLVIGPTRSVLVPALVDSGADCSVFHRSLMDDVGIRVEGRMDYTIAGISGPLVGVTSRLWIRLGPEKLQIAATIISGCWPHRFNILGRCGVFNQFNEVAFIQRTKTPFVEFRRG